MSKTYRSQARVALATLPLAFLRSGTVRHRFAPSHFCDSKLVSLNSKERVSNHRKDVLGKECLFNFGTIGCDNINFFLNRAPKVQHWSGTKIDTQVEQLRHSILHFPNLRWASILISPLGRPYFGKGSAGTRNIGQDCRSPNSTQKLNLHFALNKMLQNQGRLQTGQVQRQTLSYTSGQVFKRESQFGRLGGWTEPDWYSSGPETKNKNKKLLGSK